MPEYIFTLRSIRNTLTRLGLAGLMGEAEIARRQYAVDARIARWQLERRPPDWIAAKLHAAHEELLRVGGCEAAAP